MSQTVAVISVCSPVEEVLHRTAASNPQDRPPTINETVANLRLLHDDMMAFFARYNHKAEGEMKTAAAADPNEDDGRSNSSADNFDLDGALEDEPASKTQRREP